MTTKGFKDWAKKVGIDITYFNLDYFKNKPKEPVRGGLKKDPKLTKRKYNYKFKHHAFQKRENNNRRV